MIENCLDKFLVYNNILYLFFGKHVFAVKYNIL